MNRLDLVLIAVVSGCMPAIASEPLDAPDQRYRVLEWNELAPEGWEPPLIARAYDDDMRVDEESVVKNLDGKLVALPGYMRPVAYDRNRVSEFLLLPFLPHQTRSHVHFEPNQMVYVYLLEPVVVEKPFEPVWIVGTLSLDPVMTDDGPVAYRMLEAVTTRYDF